MYKLIANYLLCNLTQRLQGYTKFCTIISINVALLPAAVIVLGTTWLLPGERSGREKRKNMLTRLAVLIK